VVKHDFSHIHELARAFLGDDFFQEMSNLSSASAPSTEPAVDVYHSNNEVIVVINLPGMEKIVN
jgi:HSP20 family protein